MHIKRVFLPLVFIVYAFFAFSQEDEEIPIGMKKVSIGGGANTIVPQDLKVTRDKGLIILETNAQYMARKFAEIEESLNNIKADQKKTSEEIGNARQELSIEIESLKESLDKVKAIVEEGQREDPYVP